MYALVCTNEDEAIVSVITSKDRNKLYERMKLEYTAERADAIHSGYSEDDLEDISEFTTDWAKVGVEDSWHYEWTIVEVDEEI